MEILLLCLHLCDGQCEENWFWGRLYQRHDNTFQHAPTNKGKCIAIGEICSEKSTSASKANFPHCSLETSTLDRELYKNNILLFLPLAEESQPEMNLPHSFCQGTFYQCVKAMQAKLNIKE